MAVHSFTAILCDANTMLQTSRPMIHALYGACDTTLRSCLSRFCRLQPDDEIIDTDIPNLPRKPGNTQVLI